MNEKENCLPDFQHNRELLIPHMRRAKFPSPIGKAIFVDVFGISCKGHQVESFLEGQAMFENYVSSLSFRIINK